MLTFKITEDGIIGFFDINWCSKGYLSNFDGTWLLEYISCRLDEGEIQQILSKIKELNNAQL